ncbi:hypothetical protein CEW92_13485 [Bacillaceae bacterium SAS-127]|nr:hypothetical protein CEW92_13485 [Bacillaceae bacterium SAS-127]
MLIDEPPQKSLKLTFEGFFLIIERILLFGKPLLYRYTRIYTKRHRNEDERHLQLEHFLMTTAKNKKEIPPKPHTYPSIINHHTYTLLVKEEFLHVKMEPK